MFGAGSPVGVEWDVPDLPAAAARLLADVAARLFGLSLASVESRSRLVPVQDMLASPLRIKLAVGVPVVAVFVKLRPGGRALEDRVAPPTTAVNDGWDG